MKHSLFHDIKAFVFDVDGVLTDGSVLVTESGDLLRTMNVNDGQVIKFALDAGYVIAIITKGKSKGVKERLLELGIHDIYDNLSHKLNALIEFKRAYNLKKEDILYMGDDIPDLEIKDHVGIFSCPNDARPEVLKEADYISPEIGGRGCVREIIRRVMRIQDKWIY